jgi:DNA polymerase V
MQKIEALKFGGGCKGAGRPKGSGRYGEPTFTVRIPVSLIEQVAALVLTNGRKLPSLLENQAKPP